jgi:hypothetical protein
MADNAESKPATIEELGPHHKAFPEFEHLYLLTNAQLADAKAAVFLALATSAIAYLAARYGVTWLKLADINLRMALLPLTSALLAISAADALAVIVPRFPEPQTGIISFQSIAHSTKQQYVNEVLARSPSEMFHEQLAYCGELARICTRKYQLLGRSLVMGLLGYVAFLATIILL